MNVPDDQPRPADLFSGTAVVKVKTALAAARELRDALVSLAMSLAEGIDRRGYLLLRDPGLSRSFIETQLNRFKTTLRPDLADRLHLVMARGREVEVTFGPVRDEDMDLLLRRLDPESAPEDVLPSASKQDEVFLVLLHQWVTGRGPMTSRWLEETVGCNYRTVVRAIDRLGHAIQRHSDRRVSLKYFPAEDWGRLLATARKVRSTRLYVDVSDQPRSPESLLRRLRELEHPDVAVGGVLGAKRDHEDLDIVGTPRLDLCVHCPGTRVDTSFVHALDPALERTRDPRDPVRLAIHFIRRRDPLFDGDPDGLQWADPVECLLALYHARLDQQARSYQEFLSSRGRDGSRHS